MHALADLRMAGVVPIMPMARAAPILSMATTATAASPWEADKKAFGSLEELVTLIVSVDQSGDEAEGPLGKRDTNKILVGTAFMLALSAVIVNKAEDEDEDGEG